MKLLVEKVEHVTSTLEEREGKKSLFLEGVFMQSELKNRNGRIYPKGIMESAVGKYITEKIQTGTAYGELCHPSGPNINPDRVSHIVESLKWDGNNVIGRAKVGGPMGDSVVKLMELGGQIGVSSRGLGSLKQNKTGIMEVQDDFRIAAAADIVLDPSGPSCWVKGINEDLDYFFDATKGIWMAEKSAEAAKSELRQVSKAMFEETALRLVKNLLESINQRNR